MTLKQLQRYLETEKWRETAKRGYDLCGGYARCAHCNRYDEYPCAEAHNRYVASHDVPAEEEGLLPEPAVKRVFGTELAEDSEKGLPARVQPEKKEAAAPIPTESVKAPERAESVRAPSREAIPIQRLVRERRAVPVAPVPAPVTPAPVVPVEPAPAISAEPAPEKKSVQPHLVLSRGRGRGEHTRVLVLRRK